MSEVPVLPHTELSEIYRRQRRHRMWTRPTVKARLYQLVTQKCECYILPLPSNPSGAAVENVPTFRNFHNTDPPRLLKLWHTSSLGLSAAEGFPCEILELSVYSRPYFDRRGLIVAEEDDQIVGMIHAGFAASSTETGLDSNRGTVSSLIVQPEFRRSGIGRELLARAESYLVGRGATTVMAGAGPNNNGFYHAIYGGVEPSGFSSDSGPWTEFFGSAGYEPGPVTVVLHRDLEIDRDPMDSRLLRNRRRLNMLVTDRVKDHSWWWHARHSHQDTLQIELVDRASNETVANGRIVGLDMYIPKWGVRAVGLRDVVVTENERRQGYAFSLVVEICRQLREQSIRLVEVQIPQENTAALELVDAARFQRVAELQTFQKSFS